MSQKFQRPSASYSGQAGLTNRTKYADDATASPKRAISSSKMDGDFNYLIDAVNTLDDASGSRASIAERLDVSLNADGTLKVSVAGALDEWVIQQNPGTIGRTDNSTFTLGGGDFTAIYRLNRRVRVTVGGVALVGDVASVAFAGGITTVSLVDLYDPAGNLAVIASAPTQVAYGPLTPGLQGNTPRRTEGLAFMAGGNTYAFGNDAGDLAIRRNGSLVARVGSGGLNGYAAASIGTAALQSGVNEALAPIGAVLPFAGSSAPAGWLLCAGQAVSRSTYAALFGVLATTYGVGDGTTTFNLPDLRGRAVFGRDDMGGSAANRITNAVSGITATTLGAAGGNQAMQSHTHTATVNDPGHSHAIANGTTTAGSPNVVTSGTTNQSNTSIAITNTTGITVANATSGTGSSQNMPPALVLNFIIKA